MRGAFLWRKMQLPNDVLCAKRQTRALIHKPRKLLTCLGLLGPSVRVGPWVQIHILAMRNLCATYAHPMRNISRIRREIRLLTLKGHCSRHSQRICMIKSEDCSLSSALHDAAIKTSIRPLFLKRSRNKGACGSKISACDNKQIYRAFDEKFAC